MATMYALTETSPFMMSFVIVTQSGNCIVVDGGREADMPLLKKYVAGRKIKAWILTHAHNDHVDGFVAEMQKNGGADFDIDKVYYNFPDYDALIGNKNVPDYAYFCQELNEILPAFNGIKDKFADKAHIVRQGEKISVDELEIEFLYALHDGLYSNLMNDASLVFKITGGEKTVLFLGDLGPEGGDVLYRESRHKLKADIVQMAHHGHMNVGMEVYAAVAPKACVWCAPVWLYEEAERPDWMTDEWFAGDEKRRRMYGTAVTRAWLKQLGVQTHYVTGNGTQTIEF
ncbi:MAG: MBL fold metallo-hydrolase [Clostridia bacterium]|nr:MBL fold metallo-hydrolase [Clostridia bacterium]